MFYNDTFYMRVDRIPTSEFIQIFDIAKNICYS